MSVYRNILIYVLILFSFSFLNSVNAENTSNKVCGNFQQDSVVSHTENFIIHYPINKWVIFDDYLENDSNMYRMNQCLEKAISIDSIAIYSFSSPDGPYKANKKLSNNRGHEVKQKILEIGTPSIEAIKEKIKIYPVAENWDGLYDAICEKYHYSDKEHILSILNNKKLSLDAKERKLRKLPAESWNFICDSIFPALRYAECICSWSTVEPKSTVKPIEPMDNCLLPITYSGLNDIKTEPLYLFEETHKTIFALRSNLLTTAISWLNIGIEIPFCGNKFSFAYDHQFPWWRWGQNNNKFCMRYLQTGGEFRWWFHPRTKPSTRRGIVRDCLSGHYLGVYGMGGKYDFERNRDICYQGEFWSVGLTYGYSLPISRYFNLDFFISVGYASIPYRHFIPSEDFSELFRDPEKCGTWHYFGPTKVGVTLVYPINIKRTVKTKKGGLR